MPVHLSDCCSTNLDDLQKITEKHSHNRKGKRTEVSKKPDERERLKAAELLGKRFGMFKESVDITSNGQTVIIDDIE